MHSQTGRFQEAIHEFESILLDRPSEIGVLLSLAQTHLDLGRDELSTGFLARAEQSFGSCVRVAVQVIHETSGFRSMAWKTVADAIFSLSKQSSFTDAELIHQLLSEVSSLISTHTSDRLSGLLSLPPLGPDSPVGGRQALEVAIVAYDYRILLGSSEDAAMGSSWYDLGIALHTWSSKTLLAEKKEPANKQAVAAFTKALREEPGNDTYWNALGSINFTEQPKTAQHAFIKALEIDHKVSSWLHNHPRS